MGSSARLAFDGDLTIRTIEAIRVRLVEALAEGGDLDIDVGAATQVDVSFIQLLLAARRSAQAAGHRLALAAPAAGVLRDVLVRGGFLSPVPGHGTATDAWWLTTARTA